jgi:dihydropteroate synthase
MLFKDKVVELTQPKVMGILNVTPDSFSDGGVFKESAKAVQQARLMLSEGADFIDIGGESTRPGARDVGVQQEMDRVLPVIEAISRDFDTVISIDTSKALVMTEAVKHGARMINDVRALREEGALMAAVQAGVPVCLMHMQGQPRVMQQQPEYDNVLQQVLQFLKARMGVCMEAGIAMDQIIVDPGFGFGKNLQHNYRLLAELEQLHTLAVPVLVGMSRKSMLGDLLARKVDQRLAASIAAATIALQKGAQIIRVHDVKETVDAVKIVAALKALPQSL